MRPFLKIAAALALWLLASGGMLINPYVFGGGGESAVLAAGEADPAVGATVNISVDFGGGGNVAAAVAWLATNGRTVVSASLNGTAATIHAQATTGSVGVNDLIFSAAGVAGGVGNLSVTFSASDTYHIAYGVYAIPNMSIEDFDSDNTTAGSMSQSVDVSDGGVVISVLYHHDPGSSIDFNAGVDTDYRDADFNVSSRPAMVGSRAYPTGGTVNITSSSDGSQILRACSASFS